MISANGKHANPDRTTLERLAEARGDAQYTVVCTFPRDAAAQVDAHEPGAAERRAALRDFDAWADRQAERGVRVVYRRPDALSVAVALGDEALG
ncbi:MAG: hypothetical protein JNL82_40650 [Myxococcales bacterium]|nr:hypothetical protein [Myxococcales bacterium]